ncbi:MAG: AsmA-like C-terminal region-containing protein [Desulfovibrionaceae bacterium]|nr:AsmA-like C-terminal region-containing protein [Desulfovibrionaceae bacterium]
MPVLPRRLCCFLRVLVVVLLILLLLLAAAFWFLQRDPRGLMQGHLDELAAQTGLRISFDTVDVSLLPLPALAVSNAVVEGNGLRFSVGYATLMPDYLALLRGRLAPRRIVLLRPRLEGALPLPLSEESPQALTDWLAQLKTRNDQKNGSPGEGHTAEIVPLPQGCQLRVMQGELRLRAEAGTQLYLHGLHCALTATSPTRLSGELGWQTAAVSRNGQLLGSLENVSLAGEGDVLRPLTATPELRVRGRWRLPPWLDSLSMDVSFQGGAAGWKASGGIRGEIYRDGELLPFALTGAASRQDGQGDIRLASVDMALGADSGQFNGALRLPDTKEGFSLGGSLRIHRLSLTQWLGFARNLAPGLQLALDNITAGKLDFRLDGQGLSVPHVEAECCGARFTGSGGVASWAAPVVALDLRAERVNLGRAIPEAVGSPPLGPFFSHSPQTPVPDKPLEPGETGIGYDIRLAADRVAYGPLLIEDGAVVITPDRTIKNGFRDCILSAKGRFYGGKVDGECILGGGRDLLYAISLHAGGINGAPLAKAMPVLPIGKGRYTADVSIKSQGRELDVFLQKLNGIVRVRAQRGSLGLSGSTGGLTFNELDAELHLRTAAWKQGRLGLEGQWLARTDNADFSAQARLDGRLWFGPGSDGRGPVYFRAVQGQADFVLQPSLTSLSEAVRGKLEANLGCQARRLDLNAFRLEALGLSLTGQAALTLEKRGPVWQGNIAGHCPDLRASLRSIAGTAVKLPARVKALSWQTAFHGTAEEVLCDKLEVRLDESRINGSLKLNRKNRPVLGFDLEVDNLDLSRYLDDTDKAPRQGATAAARSGKWDFSMLRTFDAEGTLRVKELRGWSFRMGDVRLPLKLRQGQLACGPYTARFYDSVLRGDSQLDFRQGLRFTTRLAAKDFDLAKASEDRGGDSVLSGRASLESRFHAALTGPGQMPAALDGQWNFRINKGSYQERDSKGRLRGSATHFEMVSASGNFQRGICRSGDFKLLGPDLQVYGGGMIDLNTRTLDCNLTVDMGRLKDIPVRLHGSLDKPQTSIGAGKLIFAALGGMVHGIMDVIGGIFEGTWKLFH